MPCGGARACLPGWQGKLMYGQDAVPHGRPIPKQPQAVGDTTRLPCLGGGRGEYGPPVASPEGRGR